MHSFSQRKGLKPIKDIVQKDDIDKDLRNSLWNLLLTFYWERAKSDTYVGDLRANSYTETLIYRMWLNYFKYSLDTLERDWNIILDHLRTYYFSCQWYEVYDLIEFISNNYPDNAFNAKFTTACNRVLKSELSGYRFINGVITDITSEQEIAEIEEALISNDQFGNVIEHLDSALGLYSNREKPDYRNSIKESISAVEALCKIIIGNEKATLGDALKVLGEKFKLHPALKSSFSNLYGYTNDADGIRHALMDESSRESEDAKYMLISCSAFINYLKSKLF